MDGVGTNSAGLGCCVCQCGDAVPTGEDGTLRVWNIATSTLLRPYRGDAKEQSMRAVDCCKSNRMVVTGALPNLNSRHANLLFGLNSVRRRHTFNINNNVKRLLTTLQRCCRHQLLEFAHMREAIADETTTTTLPRNIVFILAYWSPALRTRHIFVT